MDNIKFEKVSVSTFSWIFLVSIVIVILISVLRFDKSINNNVANVGIPIVNVPVNSNSPVAKDFSTVPVELIKNRTNLLFNLIIKILTLQHLH